MEDPNIEYKKALARELDRFMDSARELSFDLAEPPLVSAIIPFAGCVESVFKSLESLSLCRPRPVEAIVAVAKASDRLSALLAKCRHLKVVALSEGAGWAEVCNAGALEAKGKYLLFLGGAVSFAPEALDSAIDCRENDESIGSVGGLLAQPSGKVFEAGGLSFADGRLSRFGHGFAIGDFRLQFSRPVSFCSCGFLFTPASLFQSTGGFDTRFASLSYLSFDYGMKLWEEGFRNWFNPGSQASYWAASEADAGILERDRLAALEKWEGRLRGPCDFEEDWELALFQRLPGKRILWVEDAPPFAHLGAGFPRTKVMLESMVALGYAVTLLPTFITTSDWPDVYREIPRNVEVALGVGEEGFDDFWQRRQNLYDAVILSRPNNLKSFVSKIVDTRKRRSDLRLIYDAEAVFANRIINEKRHLGEPLSDQEEKALLGEEISPAKAADWVYAISEIERRQFMSFGISNIEMVRHHSRQALTSNAFEDRRDLLFVGAVHSDTAPNALGLIWFIEEVFPLVRRALEGEVNLIFAGKSHSDRLAGYESDRIRFAGFVEDLDGLYNQARIFIAPAQFAAGIPLKIIEAGSRGVPIVGTSLSCEQLDWRSGVEMMAAATAEDFADACIAAYTDRQLWQSLRSSAAARLEKEYSRQAIVDSLKATIG